MRILDQSYVCLFVRLFVEGLSSYSRIFHSYGDASITGEGLQMLTYSRHFFSVLHLLLHEASVSNGHLRGPLTLTHIAERLEVKLSLTTDLGLSRLGFEHTTFRLRGQRSTSLMIVKLRIISKLIQYMNKTCDQ